MNKFNLNLFQSNYINYMKILNSITAIILFTISQNVFANTTISHAIAMHGEPKYNEDFLSVEYVSNNADTVSYTHLTLPTKRIV